MHGPGTVFMGTLPVKLQPGLGPIRKLTTVSVTPMFLIVDTPSVVNNN